MAYEYAWLIERRQGRLTYYLVPDAQECFDWTRDKDAALRLARERDADELIDALLDMAIYGADKAHAVNHRWPRT